MTLTFNENATWVGSGGDIGFFDQDGMEYLNDGAPSSGDGTTVLVFGFSATGGGPYTPPLVINYGAFAFENDDTDPFPGVTDFPVPPY